MLKDRIAAIEWAVNILTEDCYILDTETTGLYNPEIIELAAIDMCGNPIYNGRFNPVSRVEPEAAAIHGLTNRLLADELPLSAQVRKLYDIFQKPLLIYNLPFDREALHNSYQYRGMTCPAFTGDCVMRWYSQFIGDWNPKYGNYRWQRLPGGDHSALGDCLATLEVIRTMASTDYKSISPAPLDPSLDEDSIPF
jgi:DNA polymerase III subunit epsilon